MRRRGSDTFGDSPTMRPSSMREMSSFHACIVPWWHQYKLVLCYLCNLCLWTVRTHTDTVWWCLSRA